MMLRLLLLFGVPSLCRTLRVGESNHSRSVSDDHQCNAVLDRLFDKGHSGSRKELFDLDSAKYASALKGTAPNYEKVLDPGDCEVIVIVKGNRMHTRKGGIKVCHPHVISNFRKLLGLLRDAFPDEDLPNVILHMQTPDTNVGCGRGRPEVVCLSSSYAQNCVHTLNLPIHFNQDLLTTEQLVPEFQRIRGSAKAFEDKEPKAVWHGTQTGHSEVQKAVQDSIMLASHNSSHNAFDGGDTQRDIAVQLAIDSPNFLDASWERIEMAKWADYQAQLSLDGNSFAGNTLQTLLSGSIMMRHSPIASYQWFEPLLAPYKHYVPIAYDLADVPKQIQWITSNPHRARGIAEHAVQIAEVIAERRTQLCYVLQALRRLESLQQDMIASLPEMPGDHSEAAVSGSFEGKWKDTIYEANA